MNSLWQWANDYAFAVNGPDNAYIHRALQKIREYPFLTPSGKIDDNFNEHVLQLIKSLYPEKYEILGQALPPMVTTLIQLATEKAKSYGIAGKPGIRLIIVLMFILGSDFDVDFLHPWASEVLRNENIKDPDEKVALLHERTVKQLKPYFPIQTGSSTPERSRA